MVSEKEQSRIWPFLIPALKFAGTSIATSLASKAFKRLRRRRGSRRSHRRSKPKYRRRW